MRGNKVLLTIPIREIFEVASTSYLTGKIRGIMNLAKCIQTNKKLSILLLIRVRKKINH
jgi:hypothetical protein